VTLLSQGRAVGYSVCAAVQDPRKEVVGYRDLFPYRVALSLQKPMVDLILGDDMWQAGAYCEQIPLDGAGSGYIVDDSTYVPLLCRAPFIEDAVIRDAWRNNQPMQQPLAAPTQTVANVSEQPAVEGLPYLLGYRSE
jgi:S-DNA-T family DNA segregation ATPase FtsK/SpoIIIE